MQHYSNGSGGGRVGEATPTQFDPPTRFMADHAPLVLPPFPASVQSEHQEAIAAALASQKKTASWTPGDAYYRDPVIGHLLNLMRRAGPKGGGSGAGGFDGEMDVEEEYEFLEQLLQSKELNALVKAHNVILFCNQEQCPCVSNCCEIASEVMEDVRPFALMIEECRELYAILTTPHIGSLMLSHDIVARRDYLPKLQDIPVEVDEDEGTIKMVQLVKSQEPLGDSKTTEPIVGATIKAEEGSGRILIARVMHGGAADRSGLIAVGDEVIEVNGIPVEGKTPNDVLRILQMADTTITFKLIPNETRPQVRESRVRLRALFDYNPRKDTNIPCQDAGLSFSKGDILHIVSQEDPFWWQARREQDRHMRAGLIPSRQLQERRILTQRDEIAKREIREWNAANPSCLLTCGFGDVFATDVDDSYRPSAPGNPEALPPPPHTITQPLSALESRCADFLLDPVTGDALITPSECAERALAHRQRAKVIMYRVSESDGFDREEVPTYEAVARLFPRAGFYRPVVLVGPPGVGRNEIKRRIVAMDTDRFRLTIPHTSRAPRPGEIHGQDYFFVSRDQMQSDIDAGKFLEHGEFRENLYGTSVEGVRELQEAGLQPVLTPHYQALKKLRTSQLKPFIIYVKAPTLERLKETRTRTYARSTFVENGSRAFTDDEFRAMLKAGERMEFWYGHWFDVTVVNGELSEAFEETARAIQRLDQDAQWVPESWVQ